MKIDKSVWDLFSPQGNKNSQVSGTENTDQAEKADGTAVNSAEAKSTSEIQTGEAKAEAAATLSGAEEVEVKSFMKSVNGTPEEKMAVVRMAQKKGIALTKGNLSALQQAMNGKEAMEDIRSALQSLESGTSSVETEAVMARLEKLLAQVKGFKMEFSGTSTGFAVMTIKSDAQLTISGSENEGETSFLLDRFTAKQLLMIVAAVLKGNLSEKDAAKLLEGKTSGDMLDVQLTTEESTLIKVAFSEAVQTLEIPSFEVGKENNLAELLTQATQGNQIKEKTVVKAKGEASEKITSDPSKVQAQSMPEDEEEPEQSLFDLGMTDEMLQGLEASIAAMVQNLQGQQGQFDAALGAGLRQVLRVEVTQKMVEAKSEFSTMQKDLTGLLQKVETPIPVEDQKRVLRQVIEKLDNFIMKSDAMLYTSMRNERDLLKTSSTLQDALKLLSRGKTEDAFAMTRKAMADLDRMVFKPSAKRVEAHLSSKLTDLDWKADIYSDERAGSDTGSGHGPAYLKGMHQGAESSGRMLMEVMRKLGLNHEFEKAELLLQSSDPLSHDDEARLNDNVKAVLMKMAEENKEKPSVEPVQRALETLLGVQLMNRHEVGKDEQTMMFMVPWGAEQNQTVKVMVNGRKNGGVMSWENCSLYFSFDTKRLGQTGIRVSITDKTVSMAVFNDRADSQKVLGGYLDKLYAGFVEVGFQKGNVAYNRFGFEEGERPLDGAKSKPETVDKAVSWGDQTKSTADRVRKGFELKI